MHAGRGLLGDALDLLADAGPPLRILGERALEAYYDRTDVVDQYTAKIYLKIKWAMFPTVLAGPSGYVMAQSMLDKPDRGATGPIGTGPYKFDSWVPDQAVKVSRFDGYWGGPCALAQPLDSQKQLCEEAGVPLGQPNGPFLDGMEFRPIVDSLQRANALESGDVNMVLTTRATDVARLKNQFTTVTNYDGEQTLIMTAVTTPPFDNVHARRALAYATDRQPIIDLVSAGEPIQSDVWPFSSDSKWGASADGDNGYPAYDPTKAAEEVEAYKNDTGQSDLSFRFSGLANTDDLAIMQTLLEQWAQVGIKAQIDTIEQTAYIGNFVSGDFQAAYFRNYAYPDPDSLYAFWSKASAGRSDLDQLHPVLVGEHRARPPDRPRDDRLRHAPTGVRRPDARAQRTGHRALALPHSVRPARRTGHPRPQLVPHHGLRQFPAQAVDRRALGAELTRPNGS